MLCAWSNKENLTKLITEVYAKKSKFTLGP